METRILPFSRESIAEAARLIAAGEPVAVPTETVYGLAADATNAQAIARIYEAKGRPSFNPLIVHVSDLSAAQAIGDFDDQARDGRFEWSNVFAGFHRAKRFPAGDRPPGCYDRHTVAVAAQ